MKIKETDGRPKRWAPKWNAEPAAFRRDRKGPPNTRRWLCLSVPVIFVLFPWMSIDFYPKKCFPPIPPRDFRAPIVSPLFLIYGRPTKENGSISLLYRNLFLFFYSIHPGPHIKKIPDSTRQFRISFSRQKDFLPTHTKSNN
jgi:hypothetical protein